MMKTIGGGTTDSGTIFRLTHQANGSWTERVIWNFHGEDGFTPTGGLIFDKAGNLYGVTYSGGGVGQRICGQGGCASRSSRLISGPAFTPIQFRKTRPGACVIRREPRRLFLKGDSFVEVAAEIPRGGTA